MPVLMTDMDGNPNIGLHVFASDKIVLTGKNIRQKFRNDMEKIFGIKPISINLAGTDLIGAFIAGNNKVILLPDMLFDSEIKALESEKIKYELLDTELTALGNNILCNDHGAIINPDFSDEEMEQIKKKLKLKAIRKMTIAEVEAVGSCGVVNKKYGVIHRDATEGELDIIEETLNIKVSIGTVNMGSPYISSGVIANKNGFVISESSSGPEAANIDEGLGYLRKKK